MTVILNWGENFSGRQPNLLSLTEIRAKKDFLENIEKIETQSSCLLSEARTLAQRTTRSLRNRTENELNNKEELIEQVELKIKILTTKIEHFKAMCPLEEEKLKKATFEQLSIRNYWKDLIYSQKKNTILYSLEFKASKTYVEAIKKINSTYEKFKEEMKSIIEEAKYVYPVLKNLSLKIPEKWEAQPKVYETEEEIEAIRKAAFQMPSTELSPRVRTKSDEEIEQFILTQTS